MKKKLFQIIVFLFATNTLLAQNPIVRDQYSADPTARVFGNRIYVYPSHDILATPGKGRQNWFCMEDYHVFSSENLTDWTDHGMIVTQNKVPWVKPNSYSMWAPDCIERNGKYYFYFPTLPADTVAYPRGFGVGVAVANTPTGPFVPENQPIKNVRGIDPNVLIDRDGQAYLYWSAGNIYGAKLKANMLELDSEVKTLGTLPTKGLKEGPFMFERNGKYYLTYPHVENKTERLEYAMSDSPLGPFTITGVIMDESPSGCWTNHQSIVNFKNQWYLFYHDKDYSPKFDKARSIKADSLFFNADGTIQKVKPTLRGIGLSDAKSEIQLDRYSQIDMANTSIDFIDSTQTFLGWKTKFSNNKAWIKYNNVSFKKSPKVLIIKYKASTNSSINIELLSKKVKKNLTNKLTSSNDWTIAKVPVNGIITGTYDLTLSSKTIANLEIDWIKFE